MAKRGFMDGYKRYDTSNGFGNEHEWRQAFQATMGLDEARGALGEQTPEDILGIPVGSPWSAVKAAYRKCVLAVHPDRSAIHGLPKDQAEQLFRMVQAAYVVLEARHGV